MGGDALEWQVDEDVEDVGDGIDEPEQNYRKERGTKETGATEEQDHSGTVGEDYQRVGWQVDRPLGGENKDENRLFADMDGEDGQDKDEQA